MDEGLGKKSKDNKDTKLNARRLPVPTPLDPDTEMERPILRERRAVFLLLGHLETAEMDTDVGRTMNQTRAGKRQTQRR